MSEKSELLALWLEKLIENHREGERLSICTIGDDELGMCYDRDKRIYMFNCITKMSDILGLPIMERKLCIDDYSYEYGFWFNGYYFFEISEKKEGLKTIPYSEENRKEGKDESCN